MYLTPIQGFFSILVYAHFLGWLRGVSGFTKLFSKALITFPASLYGNTRFIASCRPQFLTDPEDTADKNLMRKEK
jgi:hypothetical protein